MKVLFLTHSFPRFDGDAPGSFLLRLAVALREKDVAVRVIAPAANDVPPDDDIQGIHVQRFRYAPKDYQTLAYTGNMAQDVAKSWGSRAALGGLIASQLAAASVESRRSRPQIIHAHWWFPNGLVGVALSKLLRQPLVTTFHGTDIRMARDIRASQRFLRLVTRQSAQTTTVSRWLASELREMVPDATPRVAPMPVATELFSPSGQRTKNRFLFAGRLNEQKGLAHILRALPSMKQLAMVDVVGEGNSADELRQLASQLGVSDRVTWHGQLTQQELVKKYQSATALVVPSVNEGLGLVAAEALLCETPVIAFRSGGLVDMIEHGVTGYLVPPADPMELAAAMDRVIGHPEHSRELALAGRQFVMENFSPESAAATYLEIYRQVLAPRAA